MSNNGRTFTAELEEMEVYGETRVGWDENTPVNETVDAEGNLFRVKGDLVWQIPTHRSVGSTTIRRLRDYAKNYVRITASVDSKSVNHTKSRKSLESSIVTASSSSKTFSTLSNSLAGGDGCAEALRDILSTPVRT